MKKIAVYLFLFLLIGAASAQTYKDEIVAYREKYKQDFLESERSPIKDKEDLKYIRFFEPNEKYKVHATFTKTENALPFELPTSSGKTKTYKEYGSLSFRLNGMTFMLKVYQNLALLDNPEYRNHLFLPFLDETNGKETYGGGRYLDFKTDDIKDSVMVIDFNKAYNPYCAFATGYSCPKPPEENYLHTEIRAGEKMFAKNPH